MNIPVIIGPTCSGKTTLALDICFKTGFDILSIDSRQVFKELDIGTGKFKDLANIKKDNGYWEIDGVKVWGYDIFELEDDLNVLKFLEFCKKVIYEYQKNEEGLVVTCGTGFYLDFLMGKISYSDIDLVRKKELESLNLKELQEIYLSHIKNPLVKVSNTIDVSNKRRIITSILSIESKTPLKSFELKGINFELFYLNPNRKSVYENSDLFVDNIISKGVVSEYINLSKIYPNSKAWDGLIYKQIREYLKPNSFNEELLKEKMKFSLHSYIRRQETYFKKMNYKYKEIDKQSIFNRITDYINEYNGGTIK